jgi:hypothetical protein
MIHASAAYAPEITRITAAARDSAHERRAFMLPPA